MSEALEIWRDACVGETREAHQRRLGAECGHRAASLGLVAGGNGGQGNACDLAGVDAAVVVCEPDPDRALSSISLLPDDERRQVFQSRKTQFRRLFGRVTSQLESLDQVVVCAINGHAVGGGWGLTLACDFRFAAENVQFWLPEVDLGVPLGIGTTLRMVRMAGEAWAKEIIMGCERYSATQVQAMGMLHRVCPMDSLRAEAIAYARKLAAKSFHVMAQTKANVNAIVRSGMAPAMAEPAGVLGWAQ